MTGTAPVLGAFTVVAAGRRRKSVMARFIIILCLLFILFGTLASFADLDCSGYGGLAHTAAISFEKKTS